MKFSIYLAVTLSTCIAGLSHDLTQISFSPASPASLDWNEHVNINFSYQTDAAQGVRFSCYALSTQNPSMDVGTAGSSLYSTGTGTATTWFTLTAGEDVVDSVLLTMYDAVTEDILVEKVIENVSFTFPKVSGGDEAPYPRCTETRIIPHITKTGGVFETTIMVENFSDIPQSFKLTPYDSAGGKYNTYSGSVAAKSSIFIDPTTSFGANMAYLTINQEARVLVSAAIISTGNGSPAFSLERCVFSKKASFSAGNWSNVFDGIAVINTGSQATDIVLSQYDENAQLIHSQTIATGLAVGAKMLYVLDADFSSPDKTRFVIEGSQKLSILALSGSKPGASVNYLWENNIFLH